MTSLLQYYKKNINSPFCLVVILLLFIGYNGHPQTAKFSFEKRNNCAPARVVFINESSQGPGISYEWNFGKGAISYSSETILEEVYPDPGNYDIVLKVIEGTDTVVAIAVITIFKGPEAGFTVDQTEGCVPFDVSFHNASETGDSPLSTFQWDFRDGTTADSDNPEHRYNQSGDFDVFLQITDNNGCTDYTELKGLIKVHPKPDIRFLASDTTACNPPLVVNFTNNTIADVDLSYHWDFGNGTTSDAYNASSQYSAAGNYDVTLRSENELGCASSLTKKSYIIIGQGFGQIFAVQGGDTISTENAILCPGKTRFGTTVVRSSDYTWKIQYNSRQITVIGKEFILNLTDSGRLDMKLIYGKHSDCPDTIDIFFRIDPIIADFEMDKEYSCQFPVSLNLSDKSENTVAQMWILPDNSVRTAKNISFTITHDPSYYELYSHNINMLKYSFMLVATSVNGCRDTVLKSFQASLPIARFVPDKVSGCVPLKTTFYDRSASQEPILKWNYIINHISYNQLNGLPYDYTFNNPGEYEVMLAIENDLGCKDTSYPVIIQAGDKLKPDFTVFPEQVCFGGIIRLENKTIPPDSIDFWHYSSPQFFNITEFYNSVTTVMVLPDTMGPKSIMLEVGYNGCISDTFIQQAFYVNPPAGSFHESFSCDSPMVYSFVSDFATVGSTEWNINASIINNKDSIRYQFASSGDYTVTLKAFNSATGCTAVANKIVKVRNVKTNFLMDPVACFEDTVKFNAGSSLDYASECYDEGFLWDFDDNTPRKRTFLNKYEHVFADTGNFEVALVARADNGCTDTLRKDILIVRPDASFDINYNEGCSSGLLVKFTRTGTDRYPVTWKWIFGDNTIDNSSTTPVQHNYTSSTSTIYWASLVVQDSYGCLNTNQLPVSLFEPRVIFQTNDNFICTGDRVDFNAPYNEYDSFEWDFGDGATSTNAHNHVYSEPGRYNVTLSVVKNGCSNSLHRYQYIIVEKADASYSISDSIFDCYPAPVLFSHTAGSTVKDGIWTFAPGIESFGYQNNYQYTYSRPGIYSTSLWVRTPNNCQATASKTISVTGPYATFDFMPRSICSGDPVIFNITSSQDVSEMKWIFGDGETSTASSPVHNYYAKGIIKPALWLKNNACEVTMTSASLKVSDLTADFNFLDNKTSLCQYDTIQTINHSVGYSYITWRINDTLSIQGPVMTPLLLSDPGIVEIEMVAGDSNGCSESVTKSLTVIPVPAFAIIGDTFICRGSSSLLQINPANSDWSVEWQPPEGLSNTNSFTPSVTIDSAQHYMATITNSSGCKATKDIQISIGQRPVINRSPLQDTTIFIGEETELSIESDNQEASYSWSPDYRISCMSCNQPMVSPERNVIYTVTIKDPCFSVTEQFPIDVIIDFYIKAPDAFTPNNDDANDVFMLETKNIREIKEFKIFNRWGNLVFETTRLDEGWDGKTNGEDQNMDTYAYYIRVITEHGYETEKKGTFLLIK